MSVKVRLGTRNDIDALVDVECSDVETWYHFSSKGRGDPAAYDELSPWERTMHGGPWMDAAALAQYWDDMERLGITPLVAEFNGKVVGHLDIIFSDELPLGRFLYLDVLTVHKAYRRRGVARALIKEAEGLARRRKVGFMLVEPQEYEGPSGLLYRSCGFEKAFDTYHLEASINRPEVPSELRLASIPKLLRPPLKTHTMVCGWYNISAKMWYYSVNSNLEPSHTLLHHRLALAVLTDISTHFFHLEQELFNRSTGTLCLWTPAPPNQKALRDVFQTVKAVASWLGIETLKTRTIERYVATLKKAGFIIKSRGEPYLTKNIG